MAATPVSLDKAALVYAWWMRGAAKDSVDGTENGEILDGAADAAVG